MNADDTDLGVAHTSSGAEALAKKIPKARVVSALAQLAYEGDEGPELAYRFERFGS